MKRIRVLRERRGFMLFVGRYAARFSWDGRGRFGNGSRWCSGFHDFTKEDF